MGNFDWFEGHESLDFLSQVLAQLLLEVSVEVEHQLSRDEPLLEFGLELLISVSLEESLKLVELGLAVGDSGFEQR